MRRSPLRRRMRIGGSLKSALPALAVRVTGDLRAVEAAEAMRITGDSCALGLRLE